MRTKRTRIARLAVGAAVSAVLGLAGCGQVTQVTPQSHGLNIPGGATLTNIDPTSGAVPAVPDTKVKPPVIVSVAPSTRALPAKGGVVVIRVTVRHATVCLFSLRETKPSVTPYIRGSYNCSAGHVGVRANVPANKSTIAAATWSVSLRAKGEGGLSSIKHVFITLQKSNNVAPPPSVPSPAPTAPTTTPGGGAPPPPPPPPASTTSLTGKIETDSSRPLPGRNAATTSGNWSGYAATSSSASAFSGITAEWQVPAVQSDNTKYLCEWIGIDGAANNHLIQTGTETDGNGTMYAWWEIDPLTEPQQIIVFNATGKPVPVAVGDYMYSYIVEDSDLPYMWDIHLEDLTQGWLFNRAFAYSAPYMSAEWITEATQEGGNYTYPANFGSMWYDNMEVATANKWYVTSYGDNERIDMFPVSAPAVAATPAPLALYNGYQYFYDNYTGT